MEGPREGQGIELPRVRTRRSTRRPRVKGRSDVGREARREGRAGKEKKKKLPRQRTGRGAQPAFLFHVVLRVRREARGACWASLQLLGHSHSSSSNMTTPAIISYCLWSVRQSVGIRCYLRLVSLSSCANHPSLRPSSARTQSYSALSPLAGPGVGPHESALRQCGR